MLRQKVLESYGYKFLRINRFNLGEDPIATFFDARLRRMTDTKSDASPNGVLEAIHSDIRKLQDGGLENAPSARNCATLRSSRMYLWLPEW